MIIVRNPKDEHHGSPSAQTGPGLHMQPQASSTKLSGTDRIIDERTRSNQGERIRLSREVLSQAAFRNDGRIRTMTENTFTKAEAGDLTCTSRSHSLQPHQRLELKPFPPQPTLWRRASHHSPQRYYIRTGVPEWRIPPSNDDNFRGSWPKPQRSLPESRANESMSSRSSSSANTASRLHSGPWSSYGTMPRSIYRDSGQQAWTASTGSCLLTEGYRDGTTTQQRRILEARHSNSACRGGDDSIFPHATAAEAPRSELDHGRKRWPNDTCRYPNVIAPTVKRPKGLDMLEILCQATLDVGPMQDNPTGCSCPKSKCVALYCDCFKAGRRCDEKTCGCIDCKNTLAESGADGARTKAIRSILSRNPRAFVTAGISAAEKRAPPGEIACNCIRSRCLKLYCSCFQNGRTCTNMCTCIGCYNTEDDTSGERKLAVQLCLEKRPDAFQQRVREPGLGCACKNNRCIRKYCECFRSDLACSDKCTCRRCENRQAH